MILLSKTSTCCIDYIIVHLFLKRIIQVSLVYNMDVINSHLLVYIPQKLLKYCFVEMSLFKLGQISL